MRARTAVFAALVVAALLAGLGAVLSSCGSTATDPATGDRLDRNRPADHDGRRLQLEGGA